MKRIAFSLLLVCRFFSDTSFAEEFYVAALPNGSEVTVPGNTETLVELASRVKLSSTENIQTLRFVPIALGGKVAKPIQLAIFDRNQERVKYITVRPQTPFLYSLSKMASIYVIPESAEKGASADNRATRLKIESDKPLSIER